MKRKTKKRIQKCFAIGMAVLCLAPVFTSVAANYIQNKQLENINPKIQEALNEAQTESEKAEDDELEPGEVTIEKSYEVVEILPDLSVNVSRGTKEETVLLGGIEVQEEMMSAAKTYFEYYLKDGSVTLEFEEDKASEEALRSAYVFLEDGKFINKLLVEKGYATVSEKDKESKYYNQFVRAQEKAKSNVFGIWNEEYKEEDQP